MKHLIFILLLAISASATSLAIAANSLGERPPLTAFLYSDIVVRARVDAVGMEFIPAKDFYAGMPGLAEGASVRVCRASLHVEEVLKGSYTKPDLNVVGGEFSALRHFLKSGDEVIIAPNFGRMPGGNYVFPGPSGCLVQDGSIWITDGIPHEDDEVRLAIDSMRPENLARAADIVATGAVDSLTEHTWKSEINGSAVIQDIVFRVQEVKKGGAIPKTITIRSIRKGAYWPKWRTDVPRATKVGDKLYVFLKRNGNVYNIVGGVNGCLKMQNGDLIYSDDIILNYSDKELDRRVSGEKQVRQ